MVSKVARKIVKIDEEKCNGCGQCTSACAEGALALVNGKAKLISEKYCDGLAACLEECPQGAISIIEREAEEFNEEAVNEHLHQKKQAERETPCACPGSAVARFDVLEKKSCSCQAEKEQQESMLSHWPVQLTLVPPTAPFLAGADVALIADCVPFTYADFHRDFVKDHSILVACPKLDDFEAHQDKLTRILKQSGIKSLTVVHMEVPCCYGLVQLAKEAVKASGKEIPFKDVTISIRGKVKE